MIKVVFLVAYIKIYQDLYFFYTGVNLTLGNIFYF
jgi:hypothetical protein